MKTFFHIFLLLVLPLTAQAQDITQTLRGTVYDQSTHEPLIGATVVVQNSDPVIGTTTDENGHFTLPNLRLGRVTLEVSYIGYDSRTIPEILITSAKEVVLSIALREAFTELEGVEIVAGIRKEKALNTMATVSARTFSVEETQRYAGGLSDPARLASSKTEPLRWLPRLPINFLAQLLSKQGLNTNNFFINTTSAQRKIIYQAPMHTLSIQQVALISLKPTHKLNTSYRLHFWLMWAYIFTTLV